MLIGVHVKNFALIEEADLSFGEGLNILTGETGAGKSILIDAVTAALGGKTGRDMIRAGAPYAQVELIFSVDNEELRQKLCEYEVEPDEDGLIILSRRMMEGRNISRIGNTPVPISKVREVTELLIDIHGQHEHQSLLYPSKHLEILDEYSRKEGAPVREKVAAAYHAYQAAKKRLAGFSMPEEERLRQLDFLRFEAEELEQANIREGEEEELAAVFKKMQHSQKIAELLSEAQGLLGYDGYNAAGEMIGRAVKNLSDAQTYDPEIEGLSQMGETVDSLLSDLNRALSDYMDSLTFDEESYRETEERLDTIRLMKAKYGKSVEELHKALEDRQRKVEELIHYEENRNQAEKDVQETRKALEELCGRLSEVRKKASAGLAESIRSALTDLNFLDVRFAVSLTKTADYTANGFDHVEFLISTNPGEEMRPLGKVASGGELSRIMLAIKAVLADSDEIPTLIFDEIDTGISGRTAQKVSEKLAYIAGNHQVLCITHLPQIASMADSHFVIAKGVKSGKTTTEIRSLSHEETGEELARLLGGTSITEAVRENAREMKRMADDWKKKNR
ncbi:MAG: DNA repair protein RecN [Lachnospiraceae bacterium]|nr:DNA repair protein RecN [Lachnospiraceae bacterium]